MTFFVEPCVFSPSGFLIRHRVSSRLKLFLLGGLGWFVFTQVEINQLEIFKLLILAVDTGYNGR